MPRNVLILAPDTDPHAAAVAWALHRQGVETVWSPSLPAQPDARYAFHIDAGREALVGPTADGACFGAIWNRRLHDPEPVCAEADRAFVRAEDYFGPDRRRRDDENYKGPRRRASDKVAEKAGEA